MARKNKGAPEAEDTNFWMGTFSDLLSLLLTFFVLLFAMKSMDSGKLQEALGYFKEGGIGALEMGQPSMTLTPPKVIKMLAPMQRDISIGDLRKAIQQQNKLKKVGISSGERGLTLTLSSHLLFDSGTAELRQEAQAVLDEVSEVIQASKRPVSIEGHTDDVPISSTRYPSNWDLSLSRAVHILMYLLKDGELRPERFSVAGYADTRPLVPNDRAENRVKNRRVELILLK